MDQDAVDQVFICGDPGVSYLKNKGGVSLNHSYLFTGKDPQGHDLIQRSLVAGIYLGNYCFIPIVQPGKSCRSCCSLMTFFLARLSRTLRLAFHFSFTGHVPAASEPTEQPGFFGNIKAAIGAAHLAAGIMQRAGGAPLSCPFVEFITAKAAFHFSSSSLTTNH